MAAADWIGLGILPALIAYTLYARWKEPREARRHEQRIDAYHARRE